ncbi:phenylalanine--tRNA ligase subunit beta [Limnohabitans sp.]|uniref:phenylalanine--tRNA ligase subunit beta n=1 Tax=Limnohabitans sp. TaxID=1907725 RepID=UPI00391AD579
MQFPESWLREFCNPDISTQALADILTMAGLEVEELQPVAPPFTKIVIGEIRQAVQHPNADRLRVCQVDVGQGSLLNIVCGAPNARVGIRVPCALVGAQLPPGEDAKPFVIKVGKLRGVESQGMLCSAKELQIADDHAGLLELPLDAPLGQDIRQFLNLDDTLFTLKLTPNLAHCLSVFGIAREVSALTGAPLKVPAFSPVAPQIASTLAVKVHAADLCGRFSGRVVMDVNTRAQTPRWMVDRLARCGQRSVSPLVDISNYVMFELGRPSHIFDLDKIHGGLQVRWGQPGESLKLLNGNTVTVDEKVGVIADDRQVESLAGIMGGDATAVSDATQNIYIEAAFWWPSAIAGRSRRYNFSTDAGHRFERGVDPQSTAEHVERITRLVIDICGTPETRIGPIDDQTLNIPTAKPVTLRVSRANKVIGMPLTQQQCADALRGLGLEITEGDGVVTVRPPSFRFDLQIEEDLIEEVARMVGYNNLPTNPPLAPITAKIRAESSRNPFAVRRMLAGLGYQETINFSFVEENWERELAGNSDPIRLLNPIASQMSVMRSTLIGSLLQVVKFNADRKATRVRVFELGRVFLRDAAVKGSDTTVEGFDQPMRVAGMAWGPQQPLGWQGRAQNVDFYDVKGDVEALLAPFKVEFLPVEHSALHPGRSAKVVLDGKAIGHVGELHPRWRQAWELPSAPVLFELDLEAVLTRAVPVAHGVARHQAVERDMALVVSDSVTHAQLMHAIGAAPTQGLLQDAVLFDIYRPRPDAVSGGVQKGEKSLAVRLTLGDPQGNLTDEQIETVMKSLLTHLEHQLSARLRT